MYTTAPLASPATPTPDPASEVWAAFATSLKSQTGVLLVIDTANGAQKASYNFPASKGWPYGVIASTKVALLMTGKYTTGNVFWYDMSLSGNSISVTGGQAVKWIYNGGAPPAICGDVGYGHCCTHAHAQSVVLTPLAE